MPVEGRQLIAVVVRLRDSGPGLSAQARVLAAADAVADACRAERVLGVSLDSAESRTSLHVALLAVEPSPGSPSASTGR